MDDNFENLAIVGSVELHGNLSAYKIIDLVIKSSGCTRVISGGARGIDSMAAEVAMALGVEVVEFLPERQAWPAFKARNLKIAQKCDALVRIVSSKSRTYGSGWTRDRARELGKATEEFTLDP